MVRSIYPVALFIGCFALVGPLFWPVVTGDQGDRVAALVGRALVPFIVGTVVYLLTRRQSPSWSMIGGAAVSALLIALMWLGRS